MSKSVFGIDFGTRNIRIYNGLTRTTMEQKNVVAIRGKEELYAYGDEAYTMYEKNPDNIRIVFPIKNGVIADLKNMKAIFENLYTDMTKGARMGRFCIAVPSDVTEVDKKAFFDVVSKSLIRAKEIKIVEKPIADAVGIGIDITSPRGNLIVNIGASTTEISIISMGGIVISKIIKMGGNKLDEMICDIVRKKYNILIGLKTAEKIKIALADAMYDEDEESDEEDDIVYVFGRNIITGLPSERGITKDTICDAIRAFFDSMVEEIKTLLERTPPELSADIMGKGIYLTGGSAMIKNLDQLIAQETDLKVNRVDNPSESVIRGILTIMSDTKYKKLMYEPGRITM
ncbi:MAG: rod shape-determining protein [Eubacterium sp.]|nr:rod shape-determining protein [Eubacterium sp.]